MKKTLLQDAFDFCFIDIMLPSNNRTTLTVYTKENKQTERQLPSIFYYFLLLLIETDETEILL